MIDQMMDGGFVLNEFGDSLQPLAKSNFIEKNEAIKIGQNELVVKSQFAHLDKYSDSVGVEYNKAGRWTCKRKLAIRFSFR